MQVKMFTTGCPSMATVTSSVSARGICRNQHCLMIWCDRVKLLQGSCKAYTYEHICMHYSYVVLLNEEWNVFWYKVFTKSCCRTQQLLVTGCAASWTAVARLPEFLRGGGSVVIARRWRSLPPDQACSLAEWRQLVLNLSLLAESVTQLSTSVSLRELLTQFACDLTWKVHAFLIENVS